MKVAIDTKCVYEVGSNIISNAMVNKSISRNEIEELKEIERKDGSKSTGFINPETLFYAMKQVGQTLGYEN